MFKFPENQNKIDIANRKIPVVFKYTNKSVKEVYLAGSFTNWKDKIPMIKSYFFAFIYYNGTFKFAQLLKRILFHLGIENFFLYKMSF